MYPNHRSAAGRPGLLLLLVAACGDDIAAPDTEIARLAVVAVPQRAVIGNPLPLSPVVELRSADGRPVQTAGILVTVTAAGGALDGGTSVATDERGRAVFPGLRLTGEPGTVQLRFTCCGLQEEVATLSLAEGGGLIALSPTSVTGKVGATIAGPSVRVVDDAGFGVPGVGVRFHWDSGRLPDVVLVTGADGVARMGLLQLSLVAGTETLSATHGTGVVTFELVTLPAPQALLLDDTFDPIVVAGETVTLPAVRLTNGLPVEGETVSYRIVSGEGVLSSETVTTDAAGESAPVTLATGARGPTTVEITAPGYLAEPATVTIMAVVPPLAFAYPESCPVDCPALDFQFGGWHVFISLEVRDRVGPVPGYPVRLTPMGNAGQIWVDQAPAAFDVSTGGTLVTGPDGMFSFVWTPTHDGTHTLTLDGELIETSWTFNGVP